MNIYFFGNSFSLVIVIFKFRKIVVDGKEEFGEDFMKFIYWNFYVNGGLVLLFIIK